MLGEITAEIISTPGEPHSYRVEVRSGGKVIVSIDCDDQNGCDEILSKAVSLIEGLKWAK